LYNPHYICDSGICRREDLFPLSNKETVGLILLTLISAVANAGGLGGGAIAFLSAELRSGIDLIKEIAGFDDDIKDADWIITGEGRLDAQTLSGKTIAGIVASAKRKNIPVAALCGSVAISLEEQIEIGLSYVSAISKEISGLAEAIENSSTNLKFSAYNFANLIANK
jgi:glycerate kinase